MRQGKLVQGKILVKQDDAETKTAGGIIIPDTNQEKPLQGTVVVVGPSTERLQTLCEVGDVVYFSDHAGTPLALNDDELDLHGVYLLMDYAQVLLFKQSK